MTAQEIFNHVWNFMIAQGEPAFTAAGSCMYRARKGDGKLLKCAAGCLLEEGEFSEGELVKLHTLPDRLKAHYGLLYDLQQAHDNSAMAGAKTTEWLEQFQQRARVVAADYNLTLPGEE